MGRRQPVVRDTRDRILDAAEAVFGERGYEGASVDDVAVAAGVTKGAVYYWFTDKADLASDLRARILTELAHDALAVFDGRRSTVDNLVVCFDVFVAALVARPHLSRFLRDAWYQPELEVAARTDHESAVEMVADLVRGGIARGELIDLDPVALTRVLIGALMEATLHVISGGDRAAVTAVVEHVLGSLTPRAAT